MSEQTAQSEQAKALRDAAAFCVLPGRTQIEMTGNDRAGILQGLCTNDIQRLHPGEGCEAFLTNAQGKTIGFVYVFCGAETLVLDSAPGLAEEMIAFIDRYIIREDARLTDRSEDWSDVLVSGAEAPAALQRCGASSLPDLEYGSTHAQSGDVDFEVRRVALAAPSCFLLRCEARHVEQLAETLRSAGVVACRSEAVEAARIEQGTPLFGKDVTPENLPQEVDRNEQAISFTKGCYLGQETVARIDAMGHVNRKLRGITFAGEQLPPPGYKIEVDGKPVATLTSVCHSPRLGLPLALAYLRRGHEQSGTKFATDYGEAEVIALPVG